MQKFITIPLAIVLQCQLAELCGLPKSGHIFDFVIEKCNKIKYPIIIVGSNSHSIGTPVVSNLNLMLQ